MSNFLLLVVSRIFSIFLAFGDNNPLASLSWLDLFQRWDGYEFETRDSLEEWFQLQKCVPSPSAVRNEICDRASIVELLLEDLATTDHDQGGRYHAIRLGSEANRRYLRDLLSRYIRTYSCNSFYSLPTVIIPLATRMAKQRGRGGKGESS